MTAEVDVVWLQDAAQAVHGQEGQRQGAVQGGRMPWYHEDNGDESGVGEQTWVGPS